MDYLLSVDSSIPKYLVYMAFETQYIIQVEQHAHLVKVFEQKIRFYNRQELLFTKASIIAYKNIEKSSDNQLINQYLLLINNELKSKSNTNIL